MEKRRYIDWHGSKTSDAYCIQWSISLYLRSPCDLTLALYLMANWDQSTGIHNIFHPVWLWVVSGAKLGHLRLRVGPHVTVAAGSHPFMVATLARRASGHWLQRQNQREDLQGDLLHPCSAACPLGAAAQSHGLNWLLSTERQAWTKNIQSKRNAKT